MRNYPLLFWSRVAATTGGTVVALLGLSTAIAWCLHFTILIQPLANQIPMQFNTALGLLASGAGLVLTVYGRRRAALACGLFGVVLGLLTLAQYVFHLSFGIDEVFMRSYISVGTSHPGRMGPNTALCLSLTGMALIGLNLPGKPRFGVALSAVGVTLMGALALLALVGYLGNMEPAYGWLQLTRMALHTAIAFVVLSVGLVLYAWVHWRAERALFTTWVPLMVAAGAVTVGVGMWQALLAAERQHTQQLSSQAMARFTSLIKVPVAAQISSIGRLGRRWEIRGGTPRAEWEADAANYLHDQPEFFRAIEWVDQSMHVRWLVPLKGNEAGQNLYLGFEQQRRDAMAAARASRSTAVTHVISLAQGGDGFLVFYPLFPRERFDGFILGVFHVQALLDQVVRHSDPAGNYAVEVYDLNRKIYGRNNGQPVAPELVQEGSVSFHGVTWRIRMWPTPQFVSKRISSLPEAVLAAGMLVAFLLALITRLTQRARDNAYRLRTEIGEREKMEAQNALLTAELQLVLDHAFVGIALVKERHIVLCNHHFAQTLGYRADQLAGQTTRAFYPSEVQYEETGRALQATMSRGESFNADMELVRRDGTLFWAACCGKAVDPHDLSKGAVWVLEDISQRKAAEERLAFLARHDPLTELPNRAMFAERLRQAISYAERNGHQVAVGYLDLDYFKTINDSYGHEAGDRLLITVAQRLLGCVRETDTVARLGGDEFAIVLFDQPDEAATLAAATRILTSFVAPIDVGGHQVKITISIGFSVYPNDGSDIDRLLKNADAAMYWAKKMGRNNFQVYSGEMDLIKLEE